ncbi:MAG: hypothetical protein IJF56_07955 [Clostridia bacterium]|nr:hypothetical protein [Clostridia bacterium]
MRKSQNELLGAMIGLVRAAEKNGKTKDTDALLLESLCVWDADENVILEATGKIRREKANVAPACAYCAMPCGSTADADMEAMWKMETTAKEEIFRILFKAVPKLQAQPDKELLYLFHMGLFFLGADRDACDFGQIIQHLQPLAAL